jgi:hypothetical protein
MPPRPLVRLARTAVAAALAAAVLPAAASAAECPPQATSKPFAPLGDLGDYFLAPGGDFEGTTTWALGAGATVRAADKPIDFAGARVLDLAPGASATSPEVCVDTLMPHLRFGTRALDEDDRLRVEAVDAGSGAATTLGVLDGDDFEEGWWVTPEVALAGRLDLAAGSRTVRLRLTALRGRWLSDGVYVDPLVKR